MRALVFLLVLLPLLARAGDSRNPHLRRAVEQLSAHEDRAALASLEAARTWARNTPDDVAHYHLYKGLALAGLGQRDASVRSFETALIIDASLTLPEGASPRATSLFREAGGKVPEPAAPVVSPPAAALPSAALAPSPPAPAPRAWKAWTGGGLVALGVAAVLGGVLAGLASASTADDAQSAPSVEAARMRHDLAVKRARTSNVLYGGGGALLAGGAVLWAW